MARARIKVETADEILFINRPLPPENADLILYVEDQITELLLADETLADTIYRFSENSDDIIIAVARKKTLLRKPLPARAGGIRYRVPSAIDLWTKTKKKLEPNKTSLVFGTYGDRAYLVCADALSVHRVFQLDNSENLDRDLLLSIEKFQKPRLSGGRDVPLKLFFREKVSDHVLQELRRLAIECIGPTGNDGVLTAGDAVTFEEWDFRLDNEVNEQALGREKRLALLAGVIAIASAFAIWLLLAGTNALLERSEERATAKWAGLHSSLKEITYLQKQIRQSIAEIMLCKTLSEKRTKRALVLETLASTRPQELTLEQIRIGERRKRLEKDAGTTESEDAVFLKGYSDNGDRITEWMDLLVKSKAFSGVTMVSLEKKAGAYHFQIECTIEH